MNDETLDRLCCGMRESAQSIAAFTPEELWALARHRWQRRKKLRLALAALTAAALVGGTFAVVGRLASKSALVVSAVSDSLPTGPDSRNPRIPWTPSRECPAALLPYSPSTIGLRIRLTILNNPVSAGMPATGHLVFENVSDRAVVAVVDPNPIFVIGAGSRAVGGSAGMGVLSDAREIALPAGGQFRQSVRIDVLLCVHPTGLAGSPTQKDAATRKALPPGRYNVWAAVITGTQKVVFSDAAALVVHR